ncbi:hypothetical protein MKW92_030590 [Papaver armeniacum]|nr:hypothetical protein MKW92_030590 [Papaver armeniacum]
MASLKHFFVALIFGFNLVSSFANAARTADVVMREDVRSCHMLLDIPKTCSHSEECTDQCKKQNFHNGGICFPNPYDRSEPDRCCCYFDIA